MLARLIICLLMIPAPVVHGQGINWHLVHGDPAVAAVDTVLVDPVPAESGDSMRTMHVRVSRAAARTSWDGVPYRSYESTVLFDCRRNTARYLTIAYYPEPLWRGSIATTVSYVTGPPRWMSFRDIEPNPSRRIINAACAPFRQ